MYNKYFSKFEGREFRINKSMQWHEYPQMDSYEQHLELRKHDRRKTYANLDEVHYTYNSFGFRTQEFSLGQSVDFLSVGCSFTEGIGLREQDIWDRLIARKLSASSHISLGAGGAGIETVSRYLSVAVNEMGIKPKIIWVVFPDILRREGFINNLNFKEPIFNFLPQQPYYEHHKGYTESWKAYVNGLNIKDRIYTLIQQIILCANIARSVGATFIWDTWASHVSTLDIVQPREMLLSGMVHDQYGLNVFKMLEHIAPSIVTSTCVNSSPTWITQNDLLSASHKIYDIEIARDLSHPGPNVHYAYAEKAWDFIRDRL
jgi:hypothetical protein